MGEGVATVRRKGLILTKHLHLIEAFWKDETSFQHLHNFQVEEYNNRCNSILHLKRNAFFLDKINFFRVFYWVRVFSIMLLCNPFSNWRKKSARCREKRKEINLCPHSVRSTAVSMADRSRLVFFSIRFFIARNQSRATELQAVRTFHCPSQGFFYPVQSILWIFRRTEFHSALFWFHSYIGNNVRAQKEI